MPARIERRQFARSFIVEFDKVTTRNISRVIQALDIAELFTSIINRPFHMRIRVGKRIGTFVNRRIRIVKVVDIHTVFLDFDFFGNKVASSIFAVVIKVARFAARRAVDTKVIRQIKRNRISKKRGQQHSQ